MLEGQKARVAGALRAKGEEGLGKLKPAGFHNSHSWICLQPVEDYSVILLGINSRRAGTLPFLLLAVTPAPGP